jgi:Undecaprenyl-phosphate glucose phosphotransferase
LRSQYNRFLRGLFFSVDLLVINLAFVLSFILRFGSFDQIFFARYYNDLYIPFWGFYNLGWLAISSWLGFYKPFKHPKTTTILSRIIRVCALFFLFLSIFFILIAREDYSRQFFFVVFFLVFVFMIIVRLGIHFFFRYSRNKGLYQSKVIIVGFGSVGKELRDYFIQHPEQGFNFFGFFDQNLADDVRGDLDQMRSFCKEEGVEEIYISIPDTPGEAISSIVEFGEQNMINVILLPNFLNFSARKLDLDFYGTIPLLITQKIPLSDPFNRFVKRIFDMVFSLFMILFVLSWLVPFLAVFIYLDSPGPIFFAQNRSGYKNDLFRVFKFRSMVVNKQSDSIQATKDDKRITRIGRFLRKTSIDEFPQFFNVLMGDMSIVGPRPHMPFQTEEYSRSIERYMIRHFVKPGITGLAQVSGYRGETKEASLMKIRVKLDRIYIEQWSLLLDLKIIFQTLFLGFKKQKYAY